MKLSVVMPVLNQIDLAKACYMEAWRNASCLDDKVEFIIIDNGSDVEIEPNDFHGATILRLDKNVGVYPTFNIGMNHSSGDIVMFMHSDVVVWEKGWDQRIIDLFIAHPSLGLAGFVGSNEIDAHGGRGGGTASNFQGRTLDDRWKGSLWSDHGKHLTEHMPAAVVDGCVMILRRHAWDVIGYRKDFPPHHFYDRLISTQMLERGFSIKVIGIEFDHISGQTVNAEKKYQQMAREWLSPNGEHEAANADSLNYDSIIYKLAEDRWLDEYRDKKHLVPIIIT